MHKNVGRTDAMIRMTGGLLGLAYGIGRMSRRPYNAPWLLMAFSAMKVAEGATRFCPMYAAMGINTTKGNGMQGMMDQLKKKGVQMAVNQFTRSMNIAPIKDLNNSQDDVSNTSATTNKANIQYSASPQRSANQEKQPIDNQQNAQLTPEDQILEKAAREFISFRSQENNTSSNRYPTYT
ncbi:YgaP family membrane protein [Brevibacillus sp. FIR094]|uniref:YgaP family membrane protein n=1 Tax=Brevibacillus sp. FIR094 TaxID=3134809 RepID=UPI003D205F23